MVNFGYSGSLKTTIDNLLAGKEARRLTGGGDDLLEGADFQSDGHSFGVIGYNGTNQPRTTWFGRVTNRFRATTYTNNNASGAMVHEVAGKAVQSAAVGYRGVVLWDCVTNDASRIGTVTGASASFTNGLLTYLHVRRALARYEAETYATETGTWSALTDGYASGGTARQTTAQNASQSYSVGGNRYWFFLVGGGVTTSTAGTVAIAVDGTTVNTVNLANLYIPGGNTGSRTWYPYVIPVDLADTGSHTITITKTDATTNPVIVDALCVRPVASPLIVLHKGTYTTASGAATNSAIDTLNGIVDTVAAQVATDGSIITVDSSQIFVPASHTIDGLHPNNFGAALIATNVSRAIRAITTAAAATLRVGVDFNGPMNSTASVTQPVGASTVSDNFNRANSTTSLGTATTGQSWTAPRGTWGISSNTAYCVSKVDNQVAVIDTAKTDQKLTFTASTLGSGLGVLIRSDSAGSNYYLLYITSNAGRVSRYAGGVSAAVVGNLPTISIGDGAQIEFAISGSTITVKVNGTLQFTATDANLATGTYAGLRQSGTTAQNWDDFSVA